MPDPRLRRPLARLLRCVALDDPSCPLEVYLLRGKFVPFQPTVLDELSAASTARHLRHFVTAEELATCSFSGLLAGGWLCEGWWC